MADDARTPADLSRDLDVPAKRIRDVLRARYGLLAERGKIRWRLSDDQVAHVRRAFGRD